MTAAWLLSALALVLLPGAVVRGRSPEPVVPRDPKPETGAASHSRWPLGAAVLALAGALVAVFGQVVGGVIAVVVAPVAGAGLRAWLRRPVPIVADRSLALALDLTAAALRAGRPTADALTAAAPAAGGVAADALLRVAGLLRLGADPAQAWSVLARAGSLAPVATAAIRSAESGARLASAFERLAVEIRADAAATAAGRAHRGGVVAMGPLAACFLPSFVCLGVVPVVVGMARAALRTLP